MRRFPDLLPIDEALPRLESALAEGRNAVLVAPPGAGKTTRVPLALLDAPWRDDGRIIVLEPRRIAARAAAARMAATLGESVGDTVGLRVRMGSRIGPHTRVEVVTEGVFARLVLDDPELRGIAAVLFDEFHERSLDADLGLALALDAQAGFREDLRVLVMSATLDGARVARLLGAAPLIESAGRAFPVETRHADADARLPLDQRVAEAIDAALRSERGSLLAFLPGQSEIRHTAARLAARLADGVDIVELHGGLDPREQERAIRPAPPGRRKVVLATAIAETSLTIEGVRLVVDCGVSRVPVYEPAVGVTRLATVRVSRAAADQRRGRAGRTEPGVCWRLWPAAATASLPPFHPPEMLAADLSGLVLDLAAWGVADPAALAWLDPPPAPAWAEARALVAALGCIDPDGGITARGQAVRALPLPPRLAAMVLDAAAAGETALAAEIAVVVVERGLGGDDADLNHRLDRFRRDRSRRADDARRLAAGWAATAAALARPAAPAQPSGVGGLLALAFPDRVAQARGRAGAFRLANGRQASLDPADPLAREPFLAIADIAGSAASARILLAAPIAQDCIERLFAARIQAADEVAFDAPAAALRARAMRRLGAVVLAETPRAVAATEAAARVLADGIAGLGIGRLPWTAALAQWRDRVMFLRRSEGDGWPDLSDEALAATAGAWLAPFLAGRTALAEIGSDTLAAALEALTPWEQRRRLDAAAPTHMVAPTGSRLAIDYAAAEPSIAVRVQELFGLDRHPTIAGGRIALVVELLSPAGRPVQVTRDLPGFWRGSYAAVRAEMRGRYPKHPWPADPTVAEPTRRAKPRGT